MKNDGKIMKKNDLKLMVKSWEIMQKSWKNDGKIIEN